MTRLLAYALLAATAAALIGATPSRTARYSVAGSIAGPDGGWDYASVDATTGQVYVARSTGVTVIDPAHPAAVRSIGTVVRGHSVVPMPDRNLLLVTSGGDDTVRLIDPADGREVARIPVDHSPDAAFYDVVHHRAAVMNAKSGTVSVIDVPTRKVVRTIALKPGLEFGQAGPGDTLFVNNEDANEIETANLATGAVGPAIALPGCEGPSGLAYDARRHWLISACANAKAAVIDADTRREVALLDIGQGADAVILDARARLAFIPCGRSGSLTMIALASAVPTVVATIPTEPGARTGAVDPRTGTLYLPTARFSPPLTTGGRRPVAQTGSFHVLVVKAGG
ncbi:YncE family protein [Sphingomonas bacterium]|uniref:YncE family protein n=1 Tax=Sphingomonas bacterium TaxID=1895847 RepID=UPI0015773FFD|nr:YncE family protein [Sphingomonas bacterium]